MYPRRSLTHPPAITLLIALLAAQAFLSSTLTAYASPLARLIASSRHRSHHHVLLPGELRLRSSLRSQPCAPALVYGLPITSLAPRLAPRVFVDDTPPPSLEPLQTARVEFGVLTPGPRSPIAAPRRNGSFSVCNRQRAP